MKKILFAIPFFVTVVSAIVAFHACSADDDANEGKCPEAQLLLVKSHEFAKRYNVDLSLNKDSIDEISKALTVEQMEEDFRDWASVDCTFKLHNKGNSPVTTNKLRINKRRVAFESTDIVGHYEGTASNNSKISVEVYYNIGNKGSGLVRVNVSYHDCTGSVSLVPTGYTFYGGDKCSFTAVGTVNLVGPRYNGCYHVCIEKSVTGDMYCTVSKI